MNSIVVTSTKQNIKFGYEGEDNVTKIIFPYDESWLEYGEGNFEVRILRCGDEVAYTATDVVDDRQAMTLTMTVTDIELSVRGRGEMQLCYVCPDSIKKSPIYQYTVNRSVDYKYAVDPPEGSIIASVEKSLSEIKNTTNRLSNSVISIESSINDVNSQIDNINNKISEFDEEIDSVGEVGTKVDNLETSVESISGRINTAEGNINENTESISDLNESVTELENRKVTDLLTSGGKSDSGKYLTVGTDGKIKATSLTIPPTITVDASLSTTSTNPVQNKVIKTELNTINSNIATCNTEISKINGSLDSLFEQEINAEKTGTNIIVADAEMRYALLSSNTEQSVAHTNKNILATPYDIPTYTSNGVTYTTNADGSIYVRGTATGLSTYQIVYNAKRRPIKAGVYTISGCPKNGGPSTLDLTIGITGVGEHRDYGEGVTVNLANDTTYYLVFHVASGQTVDFTVYPQIEPGETASAWVEHEEAVVDSTTEEVRIALYDGINVFTAEDEFTVKYNTKKASESHDVVNVKDLGAVGDGITDDTTALKNALLQGAGKTVYIPSGTYLFSETLVVQSGTHLKGAGSSSILKLANTYNLTAYAWRPAETLEKNQVRKPYIMTSLDSSGCTIENFALEGQTLAFTDDNEDGIAILGSNHIVRNIIIENIDYFPDSFSGRTSISPGEGIYVAFAKNIIVENIRVKSCGYEGIGTESCETVLIQNCTVGKCNQTGIQIHRSSNHIKVIGNTVKYDTSGGGAMTLHAFSNNPMDDIQIIGNYFDGSFILVGGAENNMRISGNYICGALSCNNQVYRDRIVITDNVMDGGIILYADNVIIANNAIKVNVGTYMVRLYGNKNVVENNLPMGSVSLVWIVPHDTQ